MLEGELAGLVEEDVDDDALGGARSASSMSLLAAWLSAPTSFMRAPGKATLKTRVFAVFVR